MKSGANEMDRSYATVKVDAKTEERARRLHDGCLVVNACDTAEWTEDYVVNRLKPSGVNVTVPTMASHAGYAGTGEELASWFSRLRVLREHVARATCYADIERAVADGKVAAIYAFQSDRPLDGKLDLLDVYYEMGVRVLQITYNKRGYSGDGCLETFDGGLSDWGAKLVERMNELGMIIDLSHTSPKTSTDVLNITKQPVIFSHSNCKALINNIRNVDDTLLAGIKRCRGFVGINVLLSMVSKDFHRTPSIDELMDHVDYVAKTIGWEYVGFGLDRAEGMPKETWESFGFPPEHYPCYEDAVVNHAIQEVYSIRQFGNLTRMLVKRGYTDEQVKGILGGNFLRVFKLL